MPSEKQPAPFGDHNHHYAAHSLPGNRKQSEEERKLEALLADFDPKLEERVSRTIRQWNNILRDYLRTEMAFRLTVGDDSESIPMKIVPGLPRPLAAIIQPLDTTTLRLMLNLPLLNTTADGLAFLARHSPEPDTTQLAAAERIVRAHLQQLQRIELQKQLAAIHQDILGAYFFRVPAIQIYWMAIGLISRTLNIDPEALTTVVLLHELAHAYSHRGRDIDANRWDVNAFASADIHIVEGIAQYYTETICKKNEG